MNGTDPYRFATAVLLTIAGSAIAGSVPALAEDAADAAASEALAVATEDPGSPTLPAAQSPADPAPAGPGSGGVWGGLLGSDWGQAAADLRAASESAERWVLPLAGTIESIAESMARMSSGFDPFGYQASAATMTRQAEIIAEQQRTIDRLREAEIRRLRAENRRLRQRLNSDRGQPGG